MDFELLKEIGLTRNEATIYLSLIQSNESTANEVSEKTGLHRSYVYDTLSKMANKGLVSYLKKSGIKYFKGVHPQKLLDINKERGEKIKDMLPDLLQLYKQEKPEYEIEIFEGKEGIKTHNEILFSEILEKFPKEICQIGVKTGKDHHILKYHLNNIMKRAEKKGIIPRIKKQKEIYRVLFDPYVKGTKRPVMEWSTYRFLPKGFDSKNKNFMIIDDYVTIESHEGKPFVIKIQNKEIADFFRQLFDELWKNAEQ